MMLLQALAISLFMGAPAALPPGYGKLPPTSQEAAEAAPNQEKPDAVKPVPPARNNPPSVQPAPVQPSPDKTKTDDPTDF